MSTSNGWCFVDGAWYCGYGTGQSQWGWLVFCSSNYQNDLQYLHYIGWLTKSVRVNTACKQIPLEIQQPFGSRMFVFAEGQQKTLPVTPIRHQALLITWDYSACKSSTMQFYRDRSSKSRALLAKDEGNSGGERDWGWGYRGVIRDQGRGEFYARIGLLQNFFACQHGAFAAGLVQHQNHWGVHPMNDFFPLCLKRIVIYWLYYQRQEKDRDWEKSAFGDVLF